MIQVVHTTLSGYVDEGSFRILSEVIDTDPILRSLRALAADLVDKKAVSFAAHLDGTSFWIWVCHKVSELHR